MIHENVPLEERIHYQPAISPAMKRGRERFRSADKDTLSRRLSSFVSRILHRTRERDADADLTVGVRALFVYRNAGLLGYGFGVTACSGRAMDLPMDHRSTTGRSRRCYHVVRARNFHDFSTRRDRFSTLYASGSSSSRD